MTIETIGFVGLGAMGRPMALNVLKAGFRVQGYDVDPAPVAAVAGAGGRACAAPGETAAGAQAVILLPFDYAQIETCVFGPGGLAETAQPETLLVVMATVAPAEVRRLAEQVAHRGLRVVDAPVTGGVVGAEAGTLTAIVGGAADDVGALAPVFNAMCRKVVHMGGVGAGLTLKMLNQMLYGVHLAVASEVLALADRAGLDLRAALDVLTSGAADSWVLRHRGAVIADGTYQTGGRTGIMLKDLPLALDTARALHQPAFMAATALQLFQLSAALGYADADDANLARALREFPK